jgi:hypothetical protein
MTQTFRPSTLLGHVDTCARCSHDDAEHFGQCHTDIFTERKWVKCQCPGFMPAGQ